MKKLLLYGILVDYAKAGCEKEPSFEEKCFPFRALPFPNLFEQQH